MALAFGEKETWVALSLSQNCRPPVGLLPSPSLYAWLDLATWLLTDIFVLSCCHVQREFFYIQPTSPQELLKIKAFGLT